jgi:prepilin-type N-terminal cleavage/methylation domain-containing protein
MRRRGFTIVELIIVITIMAILMTLGVVNLRGSQAGGRDTERKTDVESIAQHLESYYTSGTDVSTVSSCTGGTITHDGLFTVHTFTSNGTLTCTGTISNATVLVVAGGGSGGCDSGGGAGGYLTGSETLTGTMTVTIGTGGTPGINCNYIGNNGQNSIFASRTTTGGGYGGMWAGNGNGGGSGGGGSSNNPGTTTGGSGTAGQGYAGGGNFPGGGTPFSAGGGGGAGGVGSSAASTSIGGDGGPGLSNSIVQASSPVCYAGGGAGGGGYTGSTAGKATCGGGAGNNNSASPGYSGTPNTGGGGGGGDGNGGSGGSGVVVIRYATPTTSNTYPSTTMMDTLVHITATLRDIDTDSLMAPGITDPMSTFTLATCSVTCVQTAAGVTPQPTINQYVYQPIHTDGSLCNDNGECKEFNLYYRTEVDNTVQMVSSIDQ